MPTYTVYVGAESRTVVQGGPTDNAGLRRSAFIAATNSMGLSRAHGLHGLIVPDGVDANATEIQVPRGAGDVGAWVDVPRPRTIPAQAAQRGKAR